MPPPDGRLSGEGYKLLRLILRTWDPFLFLSHPSRLLCLQAPTFVILYYFTHLETSLLTTNVSYQLTTSSAMATHRHYYQPAAAMHMPSKAPAPASMYPVSRMPGSPPDYSDASTTAGSRSSGGLTFSSAGGEYDTSSASYSGVDVVDVLNNRMQNSFDPTPLDRGLAKQAQT
jgi:hypothetical protein